MLCACKKFNFGITTTFNQCKISLFWSRAPGKVEFLYATTFDTCIWSYFQGGIRCWDIVAIGVSFQIDGFVVGNWFPHSLGLLKVVHFVNCLVVYCINMEHMFNYSTRQTYIRTHTYIYINIYIYVSMYIYIYVYLTSSAHGSLHLGSI